MGAFPLPGRHMPRSAPDIKVVGDGTRAGVRVLAASGHPLPTMAEVEWRKVGSRATLVRVTFRNGEIDLTGDSGIVERDGWFGFVGMAE